MFARECVVLVLGFPVVTCCTLSCGSPGPVRLDTTLVRFGSSLIIHPGVKLFRLLGAGRVGSFGRRQIQSFRAARFTPAFGRAGAISTLVAPLGSAEVGV